MLVVNLVFTLLEHTTRGKYKVYYKNELYSSVKNKGM